MQYVNKNYWNEDKNRSPGYIYLMEAEGVHGIFPGCYLKRVKIGLSRNPEARLETFHSNQPPVNMRIIRTIYVEDMATVEAELHQHFKAYNVKLHKSKEFFDLSLLQYHRALWLMSRYETHQVTFRSIPVRVLASGLIVLLGVGVLIGQEISEKPTTPQLLKIQHKK